MLESYLRNQEVRMTAEEYFEMCEALGTEPLESEIPISFTDFPEEIQQCFTIYYMLQDVWDPMGGNYLGKNMSVVFEFFRLYQLDHAEQLFALGVIQQIDYCRSKLVSEKQKARQEASSRKA